MPDLSMEQQPVEVTTGDRLRLATVRVRALSILINDLHFRLFGDDLGSVPEFPANDSVDTVAEWCANMTGDCVDNMARILDRLGIVDLGNGTSNPNLTIRTWAVPDVSQKSN